MSDYFLMRPDPAQHQKIMTWCRSKGVPVSARRAYMGYRGGPNSRVCVATRFRMDDVLHEVAHWIVAPPERRLLTNFGLGPDPDCVYGSEEAVSSIAAQAEEEVVSLVGISILHHLFNDVVRTQTAIMHHDWLSQPLSRTRRRFQQAKKATSDNDIIQAISKVSRILSALYRENEKRLADKRISSP